MLEVGVVEVVVAAVAVTVAVEVAVRCIHLPLP
jgi:hypothetical protein